MCALKGMFDLGIVGFGIAQAMGAQQQLRPGEFRYTDSRGLPMGTREEAEERMLRLRASRQKKPLSFKEELQEEIDKWIKYAI